MRSDLLPCLRCPTTGRPLDLDASGAMLVTDDGSRSYRILDGVPLLTDPERSIVPSPGDRIATSFREQSGRPKPPLAWLMQGYRVHGSGENVNRMVELLGGTKENPSRVLVVGAGSDSPEVAALANDPRITLVTTDVQPGPGISVVCDAHDLPFADGTMDAVMSQWVLEHVISPERVVDEMHRVLKPAGLVYSEVPFVQQVHFGRFDFTRWTPSGHRLLFRRFDEIAMSVVSGPGMALSWSFVSFVKSFPRREGPLSRWLGRIARVLALPALLSDRFLVRRPGAWDAASGTSFLGRRREDAVSDSEVLESYPGLNDLYFEPDLKR